MRAGGFLEPLRLLIVAVGFLTRIPVPSADVGADDLRRASAYFPLVGLVVAAAGIAARAAIEPLWGAGVATIAAIAVMILVTGALHEDGLADTADGLWGGWDPATRLTIMRDSRIGTYGAAALVIVIGLRIGLLLPLSLGDFARAVACGHVLGRASALLLARLLPTAGSGPAARESQHTAPPSAPAAGSPFAAGNPPAAGRSPFAAGSPLGAGSPSASGGASAASAAHGEVRGEAVKGGRPRLGASVAGPLSPWGMTVALVVVAATLLLTARVWAPVPLAAGLIVCLGCARLFRRRLGGITGDALGAANQVVDLAVMAAVVALARAGLL
jgi:adenosylcobinamide-GDP ribazoletransferase